MNHSADFDFLGFGRDLKANGLSDKLNHIELLKSVAEPHFSPEFHAKATDLAMKQFLRKILREGFEDEEGETIRAFKLVVSDPDTGEFSEGYKQVDFWTLDDFEYAINDCRRRIKSETRKLRDLCRLAAERFGAKQVQMRFPSFKLPLGKMADQAR